MELWVLWSAVLYVAMFFLIKQLSKYYGNYYHNKAVHLIILTGNSQDSIEWMIWSYHFWNKGKKGQITCLDTGSTDDTLAILERLKLRYPSLEVIRLNPHTDAEAAVQEWLEGQNESKEKWIVLDLRDLDSLNESKRHPA